MRSSIFYHLRYWALIDITCHLPPSILLLSFVCWYKIFYQDADVLLHTLRNRMAKWCEMEFGLSITFRHTCKQAIQRAILQQLQTKNMCLHVCLGDSELEHSTPMNTALINCKHGLWKMCYNGLMHLMYSTSQKFRHTF